MLYLFYIFIISSIIYLINIIRFIIGIQKNNKNASNNYNIPISIIIAVKNGGENVGRLIELLQSQIYQGKMEFIIVNDQSTDNTKDIIQKYILTDDRIIYVDSRQGDPSLKHKKRAIDAGIKQSKYEHLLFTDIDCIIQPMWVDSMSSYFNNGCNYIVGFTYVKDRKTILNKFQRVDLLMLLFASYSAINLKKPWACSGQNQAYTKSLYYEVGGFKKISQYIQGDDTLFLQIARKYNATIKFNNNVNAFVISRTEKTWKNLLLQRARWSGDANLMWKFNLIFYVTILATFLSNALGILFIFSKYINMVLLILIFKFLFECTMYILGDKKFLQSKYYIDFLIWFIIHPPYVFIMGIASFFNFSWKGKSIR